MQYQRVESLILEMRFVLPVSPSVNNRTLNETERTRRNKVWGLSVAVSWISYIFFFFSSLFLLVETSRLCSFAISFFFLSQFC